MRVASCEMRDARYEIRDAKRETQNAKRETQLIYARFTLLIFCLLILTAIPAYSLFIVSLLSICTI